MTQRKDRRNGKKKSCKDIDVGKRIVGISWPVSDVFKDDVQKEGT
jgi:hypothetical protein